ESGHVNTFLKNYLSRPVVLTTRPGVKIHFEFHSGPETGKTGGITTHAREMFGLGRPSAAQELVMRMKEVHESGVAEASLSEPFIGKREVAERLGKTVRTVDNWMRRGMLPYYKLNRTVAFRWSEVQRFMWEKFHVCGCGGPANEGAR